MNKLDLNGKRFGRLIVIKQISKRTAYGGLIWVVKCDCGTEKNIPSSYLLGGTLSCGCLHREKTAAIKRTHGMSGSREFYAWQHMKRRCNDPKDKRYSNYGGRGITVCSRWKIFKKFLDDMGRCPPEYTLDRINNDGNYKPINCRWATKHQQANNKSNSVKPDGIRTVAQLARDSGINYPRLYYRATHGFPIERILDIQKLNGRTIGRRT